MRGVPAQGRSKDSLNTTTVCTFTTTVAPARIPLEHSHGLHSEQTRPIAGLVIEPDLRWGYPNTYAAEARHGSRLTVANGRTDRASIRCLVLVPSQ